MFQDKTANKNGKDEKDLTEQLEVFGDTRGWIQASKYMHRPDWCREFIILDPEDYKLMAPIAMRYKIRDLQLFCELGICQRLDPDFNLLHFADQHKLPMVLGHCIEKNITNRTKLTPEQKGLLTYETRLELSESKSSIDEKEQKLIDDLFLDITGICNSAEQVDASIISGMIHQFRETTKIPRLSNKRQRDLTGNLEEPVGQRQRTVP